MSRNFNNILTVCNYTIREIYQSKVLFNVVILGFFIILISYIATEFTYGTQQKVALDFGPGLASFAAVGISIFWGVNLISSEVESRTLYLVLSRPILRRDFILGKILGMLAILLFNVLIIYFLSISIYFIFNGSYTPLVLWAFLFTFLESSIMLLMVVLLSLLVNKTLTVFNALIFFVLGHAVSDSMNISFVAARPVLKKCIEVYSYIFPDFSRLNIKKFLIYKKTLELDYLVSTLGYSFFYSLALIILILIVFNKKQLD